MDFYFYAGCQSCKKALKWLDAHQIEVNRIPIVESPPSAQALEAIHKRSGLDLKRFFNTSGQSYRGGGFKDRLPTMTDAQKYEALAADGKLIKRPLLDAGETVLVGFKEAQYAAAFGKEGA